MDKLLCIDRLNILQVNSQQDCIHLSLVMFLLGFYRLISLWPIFPVSEKEDILNEPFKKTGNVLTIGQGDVGQLGLGEDILERKRGALIKDVDGVLFVQVVCGGMHSVAVTQSGEVKIVPNTLFCDYVFLCFLM